MKIIKACSICRVSFVTTADGPGARRHCNNPECSWCLDCVTAKNAECKKGR